MCWDENAAIVACTVIPFSPNYFYFGSDSISDSSALSASQHEL
jgi:hypothetical protein